MSHEDMLQLRDFELRPYHEMIPFEHRDLDHARTFVKTNYIELISGFVRPMEARVYT